MVHRAVTYHSVAHRLRWDSLGVRYSATPAGGTRLCSRMETVQVDKQLLHSPCCWLAALGDKHKDGRGTNGDKYAMSEKMK